jgi:hypothetical protein
MIARRSLAIFAMLLTLKTISAAADGSITNVSPNPSSGVTCSLNTVKVSGTGTCSDFLFELGDSTPTVHLPGNFPILVYHTYTRAGTYTLTAQGQGNCSGVVNSSLQVLGPTITSIVPFSVIKPGGGVIFQGQNFGDLPGQILIKFQKQLVGVPLENIQWGDTFAAGTIPAGISGEPDQNVIFTIVAQCGAVSNPWPAQFTATRAIVALPYDQISCGSFYIGNSDSCQSLGQENLPTECFQLGTWGLEPPATGFTGFHASGWGGGESGTDAFCYGNNTNMCLTTNNLQNGWVFDSIANGVGAKEGKGSYANIASTSPSGSTSPSVSMSWKSDACGYVLFLGDMLITGPQGVPY